MKLLQHPLNQTEYMNWEVFLTIFPWKVSCASPRSRPCLTPLDTPVLIIDSDLNSPDSRASPKSHPWDPVHIQTGLTPPETPVLAIDFSTESAGHNLKNISYITSATMWYVSTWSFHENHDDLLAGHLPSLLHLWSKPTKKTKPSVPRSLFRISTLS